MKTKMKQTIISPIGHKITGEFTDKELNKFIELGWIVDEELYGDEFQ